MEQKKFYQLLIKRYLENTASEQETDLLFQLLASGALDQAMMAQLENDTRSLVEEPARPLKRNRFVRMGAIAASLVLIGGLSVYFLLKGPLLQAYFNPIKYKTAYTENARMRQIILDDGSEVWLNSGSKLRYPEKFNRQKRELYLEGEAFFKVFHNPEKPFVIHSGNLQTTVLGTSFNVKVYPNETAQITVSSGKVGVLEEGKPQVYLLKPAQQLSYSRDRQFSLRDQVSTQEYLGWKNEELVFTGKTLQEMKPILERWYDVKIRLVNEQIGRRSMVGSYHKETLHNILEAMRFALHIRYSIEGKEVIIK